VSTAQLGAVGERLAAEHLERSGWQIVHRNFRSGRREIDLVARRGEVVAFVEVKTRAAVVHGHPLEAITAAKRREVEHVARAWIQKHGTPHDSYRFDAIGIFIPASGVPVVEHVENAWWTESESPTAER
jgi:putative endonuclease